MSHAGAVHLAVEVSGPLLRCTEGSSGCDQEVNKLVGLGSSARDLAQACVSVLAM